MSGGLSLFKYRDRTMAKKIIEKLREMDLNIFLMHVCGTHQDTIIRHGLDGLLMGCGVKVRQGPGCPVCVTIPREIEEAITLARKGKILTSFGDMLGVPGESRSLSDIRTEGCDVRIVYSIKDAVNLAERAEKGVVFLAIGFETTAPSTAVTILDKPPDNFSVLSCHRYIPPALKALMEMGETEIKGIIDPGHVSTIIGLKPYEEISEKYRVPQVVAGFEPLDVMMGVYMLSRQISRGEARVENEYTRSVKYEGNLKALKLMGEVFEPMDLEWRGFSTIQASGMGLKEEFERYDARKIYEDELVEVREKEFELPKGCRCGEILRGLIDPEDCPLFNKTCTPAHPVGPCAVSSEGSCNIAMKYKGIKSG